MKAIIKKHAICLILLVLTIPNIPLYANGPSMPELDKKNVHVIKFEEQEDGYKAAYLECDLKSGEMQFLVEELWTHQIVDVNVIAANPEEEIDIQILKKHWDDVVREKSNISKSHKEQFRTYKSFGIRVKSKFAKAKFYLGIIVSPEQRIPVSKMFFPSEEFKEGEKRELNASTNIPATTTPVNETKSPEVQTEAASSNTILYLIAGALFVIIILLILLLFRKNKNQLNTILVLLCTMFCMQQVKAQNYMDKSSWEGLGQILEIPDVSTIGKMQAQISKLGLKALELEGKIEALANADDAYTPRIDERGLPQLPSSCYDSAQNLGGTISSDERTPQEKGCDCLEEAYNTFYDNHLILEKLRIIYTQTSDYAKAATSFGDSASGVHGISGLAWQTQKRKIMEAVKNTEKAYDTKLDEMFDRVYENLMKIDECEHQLGFAGWYRRAGFMYYEFTKIRYKR